MTADIRKLFAQIAEVADKGAADESSVMDTLVEIEKLWKEAEHKMLTDPV